jgi:hypothetical protein
MRRTIVKVLGIVACGAMLMSFGAVAGPIPNTPLLGYQCYTVDGDRLGLTQQDYFSGRRFPLVLGAPAADAEVVGRVAVILYVKWPLKIENGFVEVLYHTDRLGWVPRDDIRPLRKADGTSGGCKLWSGKDGIMFALDPGVAVGN